MIQVTRLDGSQIVINSDLIEHIKIGVDTVISLTNGTCFVVTERWQDLVERVARFKRRSAPGRWLSVVPPPEKSESLED